jgi:murein DD-endopeptidase MepM/ murein hydrolase activator NlpD
MARGNRQDLYLQVSGDIVGLRQAMAAGRTVVNEFSGTAISVIEEVEKEFAKLGSSGLPNLKQVEQSYTASFKRMSDSARNVLNASTPQAAVQIIDASAARQSAEQATAQAAGLRLVAEAASRADAATGGTDRATRAYAAAAATAALGAEEEARALREQAAVLGNVEQQLGVTGAAQRRAVAVNGQARAGYQQLSYQLGDVATQYASGTAATIIFAQQSGQVIQAISLITGEAKGFLGLLGGPWGILVSSALVVLSPFVGKILEGDDALKKETKSLEDNAAKAAISAQAKEAFGKTEAGVIADVRALTEEIDKQNDSLKTNAERMNIRAKQDLENGQKARDQIAKDLAAARKQLAEARNAPAINAGTAGAATSQAAVTFAEGKVRRLEARLKKIDETIAAANAARLATQKDLAGEAAERANDPLAQIKRQYEGPDGLIEQAKKRATAEEVVNGTLTRQLTLLQRQQKIDTDAAQKRLSEAKRTDRTGPVTAFQSPVAGGRVTGNFGEKRSDHTHQGVDYAVPVGTPVRAPASGTIDVAGARKGYGNAIYINFGGGTTARFGHLSKFNVKPGDRVEAGDIIGYSGGAAGAEGSGRSTGPHLHYEVRQNGRAVDPRKGKFRTDVGAAGDDATRRAEQAARKAEVEADRKTQNADAYASLLSRAKEDQLRLERSRVVSISEAAKLDIDAVDAARADVDRAAQKGVELDKWTQGEADAVKAVAASAAALQTQAILDRKRIALAQQQFEIDQAALDDKGSMLRLESDLAATASDRRKIARQLLKIEQDQVELALRNQIAAEQDPERRGILERRLEQTPREYELKGQKLDRDDVDPLQSYGQGLKNATGDLNEAFKQVEADGLRSLEDGLVGVITGTESVASAFKKMAGQIIADIARIIVQKMILNSVGGSLFGLPFKEGGKVPAYADGGIPGYAGGGVPFVDQGLIRGPGDGRSDSILALVGGHRPIRISNGEAIVNERGVRKHWALIDAINKDRLPKFADGGLVAPAGFMPRLPSIRGAQEAMRQNSRLQLDANVTVNAGPEFDARMERVSLRTVGATAEPIMAGAQSRTMKKLQRRDLPGGWG